LEFLPDRTHSDDGDQPTDATSSPVSHGLPKGIIPDDQKKGCPKNGTIHGDKRKKDTQYVVKGREIAFHGHLHQLDKGCDDDDEHDISKMFQI
jgi:hypothetical protein